MTTTKRSEPVNRLGHLEPMSASDGVQSLRPKMMSVAYRMLGSVVDAEDAVQDAFLRLYSSSDVTSPEGFLVKTTTRRCLDQLRRDRRRQSYVGPWVPEPVDTSGSANHPGLEESLSQGFLLLLERLSPTERAAFVLRKVFDYDYSEVAEILEKSQSAVRQILSRASAHLTDARVRFRPAPERAAELAEQFVAACRAGDVQLVERLLTDDAEVHSDGGGKVFAARVVLRGGARAARFLTGVFHAKWRHSDIRPAVVNGEPGVVIVQHGVVDDVVTLRVEHAVKAVYIVRNPDKLTRWSRATIA